MSSAQKTPLSRSLSRFAHAKALAEIKKRGQGLPGHVIAVTGAIVTINFDVQGVTLPQVTIPLAGPEYIRHPIQVNDKGTAVAVDAYLGGVSGLGGGTADEALRGNLTNLFWQPLGNKNWPAVPGADANTLALYGKTALLLLESLSATASIKLSANQIALTVGSHAIVISSTGITIDGRVFLAHEHTGVQAGGGNTGGVL